MKTRPNLSALQLRQMRGMLAQLTPAERVFLEDPDFITEDEADIIVCRRRANEPTFSAEEVLAEFGHSPRRPQEA